MTSFNPKNLIPLLVPNLGEIEAAYVEKCIASNWVAYTGPLVKAFEDNLAQYTGSKYCVATNTGTAAIHLSLICLGVKANDFVITSPFSFVAPVNAIKYVGADPIFIDINKNDWQMNPDLLLTFLKNECEVKQQICYHKKSGRRIPCIVLVHSLGIAGDIPRIIEIAREYYLKVIEDAACGMGSLYDGKHLGTFGDIGCISFNGNKIMTTSGGGALLTEDPNIARQAYHLSTQAKVSSDYNHDTIGFNYRMTSLCAALGLGQLERLPIFLDHKKRIFQKYTEMFSKISGIQVPIFIKGTSPNCWLFAAGVPQGKSLMNFLIEKNIEVRTLWRPLQMLDMYLGNIFVSEENVVSQTFDACLSFPSSTVLSMEEQDYILDAVRHYYLTVK